MKKSILLVCIILGLAISTRANEDSPEENAGSEVYVMNPTENILDTIVTTVGMRTSSINKWLYDGKNYVRSDCFRRFVDRNRNCTTYLDKIDNKGVKSTKSCQGQSQTNDAESGVPFVHGEDKLIVPYFYIAKRDETGFPTEMYQQFRIIHMSTCESFIAKYPLNPSLMDVESIWAYEDINIISTSDDNKFQAIGPNEGSCGSAAKCEVTFNLKGEIIGKPSPYLSSEKVGRSHLIKVFPVTKDVSFIYSIEVKPKLKSNSTGSTVHEFFGDYWKLLYKNGHDEQLAMEMPVDNNYLSITYDNSNNLFGLCIVYNRSDNTINCRQFDTSNNCVMNVTFQNTNESALLAIYNISPGSLVHVSGVCDGNSCNKIVFGRIHNGTNESPVFTEEHNYTIPAIAYLKECGNDEYCLSLYASLIPPGEEDLSFVKRRYSKHNILD